MGLVDVDDGLGICVSVEWAQVEKLRRFGWARGQFLCWGECGRTGGVPRPRLATRRKVVASRATHQESPQSHFHSTIKLREGLLATGLAILMVSREITATTLAPTPRGFFFFFFFKKKKKEKEDIYGPASSLLIADPAAKPAPSQMDGCIYPDFTNACTCDSHSYT